MSVGRGRGFALKGIAADKLIAPLRRPGTETTNNELKTIITSSTAQGTRNIKDICSKLNDLNIKCTDEDFCNIATTAKSVCETSTDLVKCVDVVFNFALKTKWTAHISAILCAHLQDFTIDIKFRTQLLNQLQTNYKDRNVRYKDLDEFLMDVTFLCEIFHHVRLANNKGIAILASPIVDYFVMLLEGGTRKEIEIISEQMPKCYEDLQTFYPEGIQLLIIKIREKIVSDKSSELINAMLLELFELLLTDGQSRNESAKSFYASLIPVSRICD